MNLAGMTQTALDMATLSESWGKMAALDLAELLTQTQRDCAALAESRGDSLSLQLPESLPEVLGSPRLVYRLVSNILANACAATKNGKILITAEIDGSFVRVNVEDNGRGIPAALLGKVFERGVSGSGGTGIGLYLAYQIAQTHGGTISLRNNEDKGAVASFTLPIFVRKEE
jgi:signal transduction histidine kinase